MTSELRRRFIWVPLMSLLSLAGCASLLDVDGYESSPETLCDLLDRCFENEELGACKVKVDTALDGAPSDVRAQWLAKFLDLSCAKQCTGARRCLDLDPLCVGATQACERTEDCCGFLTGKADCQTPAGQDAKQCCRPLGVDCSAEAPCCDGLNCDPTTGTCGGVECKDPGESCTDNAECCTKNCLRGPDGKGTCFEQVCFESGFPCLRQDECCEGLACEEGTCQVPVCAATGAPCDPNDPKCCEGSCEPVGAAGPVTGPGGPVTGVCIKDGCFPQDSACDPNSTTPCCGDTECVKVLNRCGTTCGRQGGYCVKDVDCCGGLTCDQNTNSCETCSTGYCQNDTDCCTGKCKKGSSNTVGVCEQPCNKLTQPDCTHSMTQPGSLLAERDSTGALTHCDNSAGKHNIDRKCVESVCASDAYCCCTKWDHNCANAAKNCQPTTNCQVLPPNCEHGMDTEGSILAREISPGSFKHCNPSGLPSKAVQPQCVESICKTDKACCCSGWDAICVTQYYARKGIDPACN